MEKILKRLTWLVSAIAFIIFCGFLIFAVMEARDSENSFQNIKILNERNYEGCVELGEKSTSTCFNEKLMSKSVLQAAKLRNDDGKLAGTYFALTIGVPFVLFLLFFSVRWVLIGRAPWQRSIP